MSRSAAALAYDLQPATKQRESVRGGGNYRLLGGDIAHNAWQTTQQAAGASAWTPPQFAPYDEYTQADEQAAFEPYRPAVPQKNPVQERRAANPVRLIAALIGLVALAAIVSGILASGRASAGPLRLPLSVSRYSALAPNVQDIAVPVPVVNVSTSAQVAATVEPAKPAPAATGGYDVTGSPSVSVRQIEAILQQYSSPAVGHGQAIYDLGVRYGVNPAYALAFFVHESGCGTKGVARFTHSIGNIRWTEGYDNYEGYRSYGAWEDGIEDWYRLITDLYINGWRLRTVDAIVPVYAPYGDNNNPPVYIAAVKQMVDSWRGK